MSTQENAKYSAAGAVSDFLVKVHNYGSLYNAWFYRLRFSKFCFHFSPELPIHGMLKIVHIGFGTGFTVFPLISAFVLPFFY